MACILEGKSSGLDQKTMLKGELLILRTKNQAWDSIVQFKDSNLLQISPNWFLGNWTLDPCIKWALDFIKVDKRKVQICNVQFILNPKLYAQTFV